MSSDAVLRHRIQPWQTFICLFVCAYLAVGVATHSARNYHWFMLLAIPGALLSAERGRRFFLDWAPLFAFWLVYDRLRLIQPLLYNRVSVEHPFLIERTVFGWLTKGMVPAHAAYAWMSSAHGATATIVVWVAQIIYFSHLFLVPVVIVVLWVLGLSSERYRTAFLQHVRAFTILNFSAIVVYLLFPVAPPWWVTLNGVATPTPDLVSHANMASAMHGTLIQAMIRNASQWFAAVPSLHGAYPVLLLLLLPEKNRLMLAALAVYGCAMWCATVLLNQHYVIDLIAGGLLAIASWGVVTLLNRTQGCELSVRR